MQIKKRIQLFLTNWLKNFYADNKELPKPIFNLLIKIIILWGGFNAEYENRSIYRGFIKESIY